VVDESVRRGLSDDFVSRRHGSSRFLKRCPELIYVNKYHNTD